METPSCLGLGPPLRMYRTSRQGKIRRLQGMISCQGHPKSQEQYGRSPSLHEVSFDRKEPSMKTAMREWVKRTVFGEGKHPRRVLAGPGKGLTILADPSFDTQRLLGLAEAELHSHFSRCARPARSFVDIGASNGWYCLLVNRLNPAVEIIACEPQMYLVEEMKRNIQLNEIAPNAIHIFQGMVGGAATTLDSLLVDRLPPFFIKVDVEGAEADVLHSGRRSLSTVGCRVIVETHSKAAEDDCLRMLREDGFKVSIVGQGWYRLIVPEQRPLPHNRWLIAERI